MAEHSQGDGLTKREIKRQEEIYKKQEGEKRKVLFNVLMWAIGIVVAGVIVVGLIKLLAPAL